MTAVHAATQNEQLHKIEEHSARTGNVIIVDFEKYERKTKNKIVQPRLVPIAVFNTCICYSHLE